MADPDATLSSPPRPGINNDPTLQAAPVRAASGTVDGLSSSVDQATVAAAPKPGTQRIEKARVLGPYTLLRRLGRGGMGEVWEAVDFRLDRHVALKVMTGEPTPDAVERFRREATHSAKLRHPNIVPVHDVGFDQGRQYLVMDLIHGQSLGEALRAMQLSYRDKARLLEQVARAVQYAHEHGVVHRDLKPANIMLDQASSGSTVAGAKPSPTEAIGTPLVMDFGLAKDTASESSLSQTGQAMGTPSYMPPEQAEGRLHDIGPRSDVYSLGAILYEMLTGRPPFTGESLMQVLRAVVHDDPVPPRRISADVPFDLETICLACLAKAPEKRYPSTAALADDLNAWLAGEPISARPATWAEIAIKRVRRHRSAYATVAAAALVVVSTTCWYLVSMRSERDAAQRAEQSAREALTQVTTAQREKREEEGRRRALEVKAEEVRRREWRLVFSDDFSDEAATRRNWRWIDYSGSVAGGSFHPSASMPCVLVCRRPFAAGIRIDWDCRFAGGQEGQMDDLSCFLCGAEQWRGPDGLVNDMNLPVTGYQFKCGAYDNTRDMLIRKEHVLFTAMRRSLAPDHTYHARAEMVDGHLRFLVDEVELFDVEDPDPLAGDDHAHLGLTCWHANVTWDNVRVYALGVAKQSDELEIAQHQLDQNHSSTAVDLFQDVLDSAPDGTRRASARLGLDRANRQVLLNEGRRTLQAAWPGQPFALTLSGEGATFCLEANWLAIPDLGPLRTMPISVLHVNHTHIRDLAALKDLPITDLDIASNGRIDLAQVRGLPLTTLDIGGDEIGDLEPLRGMGLQRLSCETNPITDLSALRGMPLINLDIGSTGITSFVAFHDALPPLERLQCGGSRLQSLVDIPTDRLWHLELQDCPITDLAPLHGSQLRELQLDGTPVSDLSPLAGVPLTGLSLSRTRVRDLSPLRGMPLHRIDVDHTLVQDYGPLADLPLITVLLGPFTPGHAYRGLEALRSKSSIKVFALYSIAKSDWVWFEPAEFWRKLDAGDLSTIE